MASYQNATHMHHTTSGEFDKLLSPGNAAPHAGIYRCAICGHEIGIAEGHTLPPQTHPKHPANKPIQWQLQVFAMHNKVS